MEVDEVIDDVSGAPAPRLFLQHVQLSSISDETRIDGYSRLVAFRMSSRFIFRFGNSAVTYRIYYYLRVNR